ncbi:protein kinase domain-containing protein [Streptomyces sp. CA-250714]|uniref:serine/threonine-protein kinase n=1 Tax=Streptomyces sp. CA-250714 TaxID=3240060 RepID=UPI003D8EDC9B
MLEAGQYRLVEVLGRGGTGEVWLAEDTTLGREVAVKLLRDEIAAPGAVERFRQEAWAAAVLNHPHVLSVYDFGQDQGRCYLVMELVRGRSLRAELAETGGPLPVEEACRYVRQAAAGLAAAHSAGVVHGDVEPGNLLLAESGVKVADFVLARAAGQADAASSDSGDSLETSSYLAPECGMGASAAPAADVYGLGCVLYELLCGRPPFTGKASAVAAQHIEAAPVPPRQPRPEISAGVSALVLEMLAKDATARPTAAQVAERLRAEHLGGGTPTVQEAPAEPLAARSDELSAARRQPRRTAALVAVSTAVVVAASAAVGYALFESADKSPASRPAPGTRHSPPPESTTSPKPEDSRPATSPTTPGQDERAETAEGEKKAREVREARKKATEARPESAAETPSPQNEAAEKQRRGAARRPPRGHKSGRRSPRRRRTKTPLNGARAPQRLCRRGPFSARSRRLRRRSAADRTPLSSGLSTAVTCGALPELSSVSGRGSRVHTPSICPGTAGGESRGGS